MDAIVIDPGLVAGLVGLPSKRVWSEYDAEADVLYLSIEKPQNADDSIMDEDDCIYHYRGERLVGITVLNVSGRLSVAA